MPRPLGLVQRIDQELHRSGLLPRGGRLLVAVSGGADSVALLRLLHAVNGSDYWGWTLIVGHVDHGIRGRASRGDAAFVKRLAAALQLPFVSRRLSLDTKASEAAARAGRLKALAALVKAQTCVGAVLAHHADDQAETVLLRLIRGTGLEGLAGMMPAREVGGLMLLRPLLGTRREALRRYLESLDQPWREDKTNASDAYLRNRLRSQVMPVVESLAPGAVEAIGRAATLAGESHAFIHTAARALLADALAPQEIARNNQIVLLRKALQQSHALVCGEVLRVVTGLVGGSTEAASFERIRESVHLIQQKEGGKMVQMGSSVVIRIAGSRVIVERERAR